jgi:predicted PurR-regulated permease PerM
LAAKYLPGEHDPAQIEEQLRGRLQAIASSVAAQAPRIMGLVATMLIDLFVIFLGTFYLFRDGPEALDLLKRVLPLDKSQQEKFYDLVVNTVHASLFSSFVIAAVQGALGGLLFALLGIPHPILWGVIMAFLSLIPMLGSGLVWVPAAIYLAVDGQWVKAGIMVAAGVLVIGTADNILRPILMKGRADMGELLVLISVIGGLAVFGMVGIVLGPLVVAIALASLHMYAAMHARAEL